jgi:hypothetical protein
MTQAALAGAGLIAAPGNLLALVLAGLWLGLARAGPGVRRGQAVGVGLACAAAGCVTGLVFRAPPYLDLMIAGSGLATAALIVFDLRRPGLALVPLAVAAAMFELGVGATYGFGDTASGHLAAYSAVTAAGGAAVLAVAAVLGRWLRARGGTRLLRGLGAWACALSVLLFVNGSLSRGTGIDTLSADLMVSDTELSRDEIPVLVRALLEQVYLAFEKEDEDEIYEALSSVAEGEVLADLYLQKRAALVMEDDGGARSSLRAVELERTEAGPLPGAEGYNVHGVWRVVGSIGHWGHVHDRVNRYEADLTISPIGGSWKITGFELRDVVRTDPAALQ